MEKYRRPIRSNKQKLFRFVKQSVRITFVSLEMQSEESPSVLTEVTGKDMIRGDGISSMQGYLHQGGVKGSGHRLLGVHIVKYIYRNLRRALQIYIVKGGGGLGVQGWIISIISVHAFKFEHAIQRVIQCRYKGWD